MSIAKFVDNNKVLSSIELIPFYINKGFYLRISFSSNLISYKSTRKRLDIAKVENIANNI